MAPMTPLKSPREYFQQRNRPSLARGSGIVLLRSIALVVVVWLFVNRAMDHVGLSLGAYPRAQSQVTGQLIMFFFMMILGWLLIGALLHFFMWFGDAQRGFGTTLAVVGEAEIVGLVVTPIAAFVMFSAVGQAPTELEAAAEFLQSRLAYQSPLLLLTGLIATLWKAAISGYGLAIAHDLRTEKTMVLTFGIGILGFLVTLAA